MSMGTWGSIRIAALAGAGVLVPGLLTVGPVGEVGAITTGRGISVESGVVEDPTGPILYEDFYGAGDGVPFMLALDVQHLGTDPARSFAIGTFNAAHASLPGPWTCTSPGAGIAPVAWTVADGSQFIVLPETFDPAGPAFEPGMSFRCTTTVTLHVASPADTINGNFAVFQSNAGNALGPIADAAGFDAVRGFLNWQAPRRSMRSPPG